MWSSRTRVRTSRHDVLARLDEALALIERFQPWRLRHLQRDLRQIAIVRFPCRGAYLPAERTCIAELTFLARRDITAAPVASSIVHEGMHARSHRMGVRPDGTWRTKSASVVAPSSRSACRYLRSLERRSSSARSRASSSTIRKWHQQWTGPKRSGVRTRSIGPRRGGISAANPRDCSTTRARSLGSIPSFRPPVAARWQGHC